VLDIAEFSSELFRPFLPEESQVNPEVYGAELAYWLARKLFGRDKPSYSEAGQAIDGIRAALTEDPEISELSWLYSASSDE